MGGHQCNACHPRDHDNGPSRRSLPPLGSQSTEHLAFNRRSQAMSPRPARPVCLRGVVETGVPALGTLQHLR